MFVALARFAIKARFAILVVAALLLPVAWWVGRDALDVLKPGGFRNPQAESTRVDAALRGFGAAADLVVLYEAEDGTVDDIQNFANLIVALGKGEGDAAVERVVSFPATGAPFLLSNDRTKTLALLTLRGRDPEKVEAAARLKPLLAAEGFQTSFGGYVELFVAIPHTVENDLRRAELLAFPLTALLLLLLFRSAVSAALPVIVGGLAIFVTFAILRVLSAFTEVTVFAASLASILGLGLAIDYALFIVARYREERARGRNHRRALFTTMKTAGKAVAFSGATVAVSLVSLLIFPHGVLRSVALGGIAVTIATVFIALTVLPALLAVLKDHIDALRVPFGIPPVNEAPGYWPHLVRGIARSPVLVACATAGLLLLLASPFARLEPSLADERALAPDAPARRVKEIIDRDFFPHQTTAHDVVITFDTEARRAENLRSLRAFVTAVQALPDVARVDSPFLLTAGRDDDQAFRLLSSADAGTASMVSLFVRGHSARVSVVGTSGPDAKSSIRLLHALRTMPAPAGAVVEVGGQTGWIVDVRTELFQKAPWMIGFIAVTMFIVLFLLFGSVVLPIKALLMNALSLCASFGIIVWIFQDGRFCDLLSYEATGTSEAVVPVLMLAIVFGLSMDYEVLLLARMREEWDRSGDNARAVQEGISRTGRLITSAAALFIVVVLCFATSKLLLVKTLSVGMAAAVFLDATIVRALLVPATMHMLGSWNWWAPTALRRLQGRINGH